MNYSEFKEKVLTEFKSYIPKEYQHYKFEFRKMAKVNSVLDSISLIKDMDSDYTVAPTIYIQRMYEKYQETCNFSKVIEEAVNTLINALSCTPKLRKEMFDNFRDNIIFELVNADINDKLLEKLPHRKVLDLAVIYKLVLEKEEGSLKTITVDNNMASHLSISESELYKLAETNTEKMFGVVIKTLKETICNLAGYQFDGNSSIDKNMLIISNTTFTNGAAVILSNNVMKKLKSMLGDCFYILPSSIHEIIAIKTDNENEKYLLNTVKTINREGLKFEDKLSDKIYLFSNDRLVVCE